MQRLFTFGCSFTHFYYPTWADILGKEFEYHENWARKRSGNQFIAHTVAEAVLRSKITKDDVVIVMWSNYNRDDRYYKDSWISTGNLFHYDVYPKEFVDQFISMRGCVMRDALLFYLTDNLLKQIGCEYYFTSIDNLAAPLTSAADAGDKFDDVIELYKDTYAKFMPSAKEVLFGNEWPNRADFHPTPNEHLKYVQTIFPAFKISEETINLVQQIETELDLTKNNEQLLATQSWKRHIWNIWGSRNFPKQRF